MQATQSRTASGSLGRTEQFAALRFISRQLELGADARWNAVSGTVGQPGIVVRATDGADIAEDAASLLAVLSLYSELLARPDLPPEEHLEYASQLKVLTDRSWELVGRFLRHARARRGEVARRRAVTDGVQTNLPWEERELPTRLGPTSERGPRVLVKGAAGWMAC